MRLIFADGGYQGHLEGWVQRLGVLFGHAGGMALEIIKRSDAARGFVLLPRRWVIERTFGWLVKSRRLVRDHERNPRHHEAFGSLAMISHSARSLTTAPASLQLLWIFAGQALSNSDASDRPGLHMPSVHARCGDVAVSI